MEHYEALVALNLVEHVGPVRVRQGVSPLRCTGRTCDKGLGNRLAA